MKNPDMIKKKVHIADKIATGNCSCQLKTIVEIINIKVVKPKKIFMACINRHSFHVDAF